jgi:glyoxylase-like metal-dependent hydrolase (beta-lactamase superfamily II)
MNGKYFSIIKLDENVYHIHDPAGVYCSLIIGEEKALLFDTGHGFGDLKAAVNAITNKPLTVINSHGHFDHCGGNYQFKEVYMHESDFELAKIHLSVETRINFLKFLRETRTDADFLDGIADNTNARQAKLIPLADGQIIDLGGRTIEVIHIPGHTQGCVALYDKKTKTLFTGDAISRHIWMFLDESTSLEILKDSMKKLKNWDILRLVPAHSPDPLRASMISRMIKCAEKVDPAKDKPYFAALEPNKRLHICEFGIDSYADPDYISIAY